MKMWELYHRNTIHWGPHYTPLPENLQFRKECSEYQYSFLKRYPLSFTFPDPDKEFYSALAQRKSEREFGQSPITMTQFSNLLFYSIGKKEFLCPADEGRMVPSAGGRYPISLTLSLFNVENMPNGIYRYNPARNCVDMIDNISIAEKIVSWCRGQEFVINSGLLMVLCANFEWTIEKYGERGYRYVLLDAGHIAQNIYLICQHENLACCSLGGFLDNELKTSLLLAEREWPIYLLAIGSKPNHNKVNEQD